ncbi:hypothetical protein C8R46DRAFT_1034676 [Mycena filopes]|nr:hypothetical protein C8R46DRAFT_1034676 [Mycena filopes]
MSTRNTEVAWRLADDSAYFWIRYIGDELQSPIHTAEFPACDTARHSAQQERQDAPVGPVALGGNSKAALAAINFSEDLCQKSGAKTKDASSRSNEWVHTKPVLEGFISSGAWQPQSRLFSRLVMGRARCKQTLTQRAVINPARRGREGGAVVAREAAQQLPPRRACLNSGVILLGAARRRRGKWQWQRSYSFQAIHVERNWIREGARVWICGAISLNFAHGEERWPRWGREFLEAA